MIKEIVKNNGNKAVPEVGKAIRIIIAGGGTGGHIFPALAIAGALQKLNSFVEILFVGAKGKMEMDKIPEAGFKITGIDISGYNRSSLFRNISLPFKLLKSYFQVKDIFKSFKPHAVIGVGGYSTYPVLRLAQNKNIPTFIHEANSLGGKSNVMLGKRAQKIFVASEGMEKYFPENKIMITGNPVRQVFLETIKKESALEFFGFKPGIKTVFVFGGSLGAQSINEAIAANIEEFAKNNLQLIWQTGKDFSTRAASIEEENSNLWTNAFITKMENAYAAADIVVCRAGAMTVAEICVVKKAAVFVPFPYAAEDHQTVNAMALVNKDAALMVRDAELKSKLIPAILGLVKDEDRIKKIENNLSQISKTHVDETIAREVLNSLNVLNK
jgi:UDP-N-acetylglucosamine--N-acetylmuramyl-(pentapeptide) pyrophosphoryl-undecaprenol N-acetylglucosamine transferase